MGRNWYLIELQIRDMYPKRLITEAETKILGFIGYVQRITEHDIYFNCLIFFTQSLVMFRKILGEQHGVE